VNDRPTPAKFDSARQAWVLSTWSDVSAGLNHPDLVIAPDLPLLVSSDSPFDHSKLSRWRQQMDAAAGTLARGLPAAKPVDLYRDYAEPWSLRVAALIADISESTAAELRPLAKIVFESAAHASGPVTRPLAAEAATRMAGVLPPTALGVQTFVALSHTLPHLLAAVWHALLEHPEEFGRLRREPGNLSQALEELLRFASPSRTVFRIAQGPAVIGDARIAKGHHVHLRLAAANRDPSRFPDPDRLDLARGQSGHLAFGRGRHACAGAQLIRLAAGSATLALIETTVLVEPAGQPAWLDGAAIRAPASLPAVLHRSAHPR
jgi:cytochrome P450